MKFGSLITASFFGLLAVTSAKAADAIVAEEPAPIAVMPGFSWSGAYIGGQVGYGFGKSKFSNTDFGDGVDSFKPKGFLGGVYAGYNFDVGNNVILGVDGDFSYAGISKKFAFDGDNSIETKNRWSGAVRGRIGYAVDRFMPYVAGGVAFGQVKNSYNIVLDQLHVISGTSSKTSTGWTAGAGVDYAATDNIILRLEYRYTDFGKNDIRPAGIDVGTKNRFTTNDIRLGVAYKF